MTTPSTDEREQLARIINKMANVRWNAHMLGKDESFEIADAILSAGFRLPVPTTPTHRCVNCKREWQETQLEVWQGFPVLQRCPECKCACAKMDPVPTTTPEDEKRWAELADDITEGRRDSSALERLLAHALTMALTRLAAAREGGR